MIKVTYNDHMGDCLKPVNMARGSYNRTTEWKEDGSMKEADKRLLTMLARGMGQKEYDELITDIRYSSDTDDVSSIEAALWKFRHTPAHTAPFGHNFLTVYFEAPVFVMRQIVKHKFLRLSEMSMRYVRDMPEYYRPDSWRSVADDVKQGSGGDLDEFWQVGYTRLLDDKYHLDSHGYEIDLDEGLCPEQARMFLRLCHMTQGYMSGSMDAWANLVIQRIDPHAQYETQLFARKVDDICNETWPISWPALTEGVQR